MKHILLNSEADRWKLAYSYIKIKCGDNYIWRFEDLPKLEAFFNYSNGPRNGKIMSEEVKESFKHYKKCSAEYADELANKRDSIINIPVEMLIKTFGYEMPRDDYDDEKDISEIKEDIPLKSLFDLTYPCICVNWFKSGYDRLGENSICAIDYVELKEFN